MCHELMNCKENSVFSEKCRYVQQIQDIERIMNSHYDLLQTLVEKILDKSSKDESGPPRLEAPNQQHEEQMAKLQEEITRLKEENRKLQAPKQSDDVDPKEIGHLEAKDSLLDAYRRSQQNLQRQVSSLMGLSKKEIPKEEANPEEDLDMRHRKVSFSEPNLLNNEIEADSTDPSEFLEEITLGSVEVDNKQETKVGGVSKIREENKEASKTQAPTPSPRLMQNLPNVEKLVLGEEETCCRQRKCGSPQLQRLTTRIKESTPKAGSASPAGNKKEVDQEEVVVIVNTNVNQVQMKEFIQTENGKVTSCGFISSTNSTVMTVGNPPKEGSAQYNRCTCITFDTPTCVCSPKETAKVQPTNTAPSLDGYVSPRQGSLSREGSGQSKRGSCRSSEISTCVCKSKESVNVQCGESRCPKKESVNKSGAVGNIIEQTSNSQVKKCCCTKSPTSICPCSSKETVMVHILTEEAEESDETKKNMQEMVKKLNDIGSRVAEVLEKQVYTCKELEQLKSNLAESRDTTQTCCKNLTSLSARIDEQKGTFLKKFQEHQQVTDNLMSVNGEVTKELSDLKEKIDVLFKNIDEIKCKCTPRDEGRQVKIKEDARIGEGRQKSAIKEQEPCLCEPTDSLATADLATLEAKYVDLKAENKYKDKQIKCIDALISYYKKAHENVVAINAQAAAKIRDQIKQQRPSKEDELDKYIERAKSENLKLKTTISSVIDCLTTKVSELKGGGVQPSSSMCLCAKTIEDFSVEEFECEMCCVESHSTETATKVTTKVKTPVELEDIYQAVKHRVIHNCRGCACSPAHSVSDTCTCYSSIPSEPDVQPCGSCPCASESKLLAKHSSKLGKNRKTSAECCGTRGADDHEGMITNLQTYIQYLHDQLHIISSIENRIEDLRVHMKESRE